MKVSVVSKDGDNNGKKEVHTIKISSRGLERRFEEAKQYNDSSCAPNCVIITSYFTVFVYLTSPDTQHKTSFVNKHLQNKIYFIVSKSNSILFTDMTLSTFFGKEQPVMNEREHISFHPPWYSFYRHNLIFVLFK